MDEFNLIYSYSRAQAIEDGVLIDVTTQAKEAGFKFHTVVTDNLFHSYIQPPAGLEGEGQSSSGRLHDLFMVLRTAILGKSATDYLELDVLFLMAPGRHERVRTIAVVGPGDHGEPVMTIMLPGDD
ncbi:hypothetical protein DFW101_2939 [Solidesulfovibrio carbinoliphilus subsp. oakridgensis]|uniref:Uncharacterized protein n=1 Tax=Solidesulfovibrio carbinoliphilus subsp. oakridgensis TaxID=694327 RepID=G7Q5E0_9BACT|nr:DUF6573 family protein [Solidesulfovibrio carbinoliphilus]EHJ48941.1 hypothetical protein DFW101_2939 [Solidesulfovibrio carbinoliphilus subsp. oakridgensis]